MLDTFDSPEPSVAEPSAKGQTPPPAGCSKPGPSQSSDSAQPVEVSLHSEDEVSDSNSHSSAVGSPLEPLGHNSDSEQHSAALAQDPNALDEDTMADIDQLDEERLAMLGEELLMTKELLKLNQTIEAELLGSGSSRRTCKKKSPRKRCSAAHG
ncbi:hypothetical protein ARMGADRAFT_1036714 [Armillaria gallica]|uniref:Uncharacterized protein n=1 Tax=Armillaria gallica TaxID=47427 RepID=A0A2H3D0P9_ARMGA|nr:hypothetical protein ARMGADRAFT_1036714 [Armillaria gallica]